MSIDHMLFRQVVGSFASGVTIITTGREGNFHGMTASSFASLSLNPTLVLVCVDRGATTMSMMDDSGYFNVNILASHQESLSRAFASRGSPESHGLNGVDHRIGTTGLPLLNGALAFCECRTVQKYDGGDHCIYVGEVENAGVSDQDEPLLYYRGKYRGLLALAESLTPQETPAGRGSA